MDMITDAQHVAPSHGPSPSPRHRPAMPAASSSPSVSATRSTASTSCVCRRSAPTSSPPASPTRPVHQGRGQPARRHRPHRRPAHEARLRLGRIQHLHRRHRLNVKGRVVGAVVDSVSDVLELPRETIKPARRCPPPSTRASSPASAPSRAVTPNACSSSWTSNPSWPAPRWV